MCDPKKVGINGPEIQQTSMHNRHNKYDSLLMEFVTDNGKLYLTRSNQYPTSTSHYTPPLTKVNRFYHAPAVYHQQSEPLKEITAETQRAQRK
jgi:hypothetical protein